MRLVWTCFGQFEETSQNWQSQSQSYRIVHVSPYKQKFRGVELQALIPYLVNTKPFIWDGRMSAGIKTRQVSDWVSNHVLPVKPLQLWHSHQMSVHHTPTLIGFKLEKGENVQWKAKLKLRTRVCINHNLLLGYYVFSCVLMMVCLWLYIVSILFFIYQIMGRHAALFRIYYLLTSCHHQNPSRLTTQPPTPPDSPALNPTWVVCKPLNRKEVLDINISLPNILM